MINIEDVARLAGVSVSTASRALRGKAVLRPSTITRVRAAADELNYVPNRAASNLALRQNKTIVLFVTNLLTRQTDEFHDGVEAACAENDYVMLIQKLGDTSERNARYLQLLREHRITGVIAVPGRNGVYSNEIMQMQKWGVQVVQVDNEAEGVVCDYVGCDNRKGARFVAEHMLSLGHRRFAIVSAVESLSCIRERIDSFRQTLGEYGIDEVPLQCTSSVCDSMEYSREATHSLLDRPERPTAIFSLNGPGALGVIRAVRERNLRCPEDVAVAAFDDDLFAPYLETSLTCVHWPAYEIGRRATLLLIRRIREQNMTSPERVTLDPVLIRRESTMGGMLPKPVGARRD